MRIFASDYYIILKLKVNKYEENNGINIITNSDNNNNNNNNNF